MKDRILTNTKRSVFRSFPRFVSLLVMSMLGVFVFAGLQATAPDMTETLDRYLDKYNVYDLRLVPDMGLTDEDVDAVRALGGVCLAEGGYSKDVPVSTEHGETVVRVYSLPENINTLELLSGRLPAAPGEIVTEANYLKKNGLTLGDSVPLGGEGFVCAGAKIVGTVDTALYFNNADLMQDRGSTSVGTGTVEYYAYVLPECFDTDVYTCIYLTAEGAGELQTGAENYLSVVESVRGELESIRAARQEARYQQIFDEADAEIRDAERELNAELAEAKAELDDAKAELDNGKAELDDAGETLSSAQAQLWSARAELDEGRAAYAAALESAGLTEADMDDTLAALEGARAQAEAALSLFPQDSAEYAAAGSQLAALNAKLAALTALKETAAQLASGEAAYRTNLADYNSGRAEYEENLALYEEKTAEYADALAEYADAEAEARQEIFDAREELGKLKRPTLYFFDRTDDATYSDYFNDADSVANLSKIFPAVFFAVAVLVSLISMNRMVEEERGEIGTMKSLGYRSSRIMMKYLLFSLSATVLGGAVGAALGLVVLPSMIFGIYGILFDVPGLVLSLNPVSTLIGFVITVLCVCGTSVLTAYRELKAKPSELMRPRAPKSGRRVLIERIGFIWKHLNFSQKVTVRNLFRYKKRVLVTVGGIAGCTALMLCGFGLRDSITDIAAEQFDNIFRFDGTVYVSETDEKTDSLFALDGVEGVYRTAQLAATVEGIDVTVFAYEDAAALAEIVRLPAVSDGAALVPESGRAVITEKLSALTGLGAGDTVRLTDADNRAYAFEISGVALNYVGHYIYVDAQTFESAGGDFSPNVIYLRTAPDADRGAITKTLLENDEILSASFKTDLIRSVDDMLKSLNSVVLILIVLAALLAFVVLYNLSNININERKREIATLKVLGFYDDEVDAYITKETVLLTALGIAIGLVLGYFLTNAVVSTVEIESCRFIHRIKPLSYVFSAVLAALFTVTVNFITHFKLKRIDMIESLKSVE